MTNDKQTEQIVVAISNLIKEIKYLGDGDEQKYEGWGAITCLTNRIDDTRVDISNAISDVADAIRELAQALSKDKSE